MLGFGGAKKEEERREKENPKEALTDALDDHEDFKTKHDGTLELDSFIAMRCAILRQTMRAYQPEKEKLHQAALQALRAHDDRAYAQNFIEVTKKYSEVLTDVTMHACKHLELDIKLY